jgi:hypothetical protein
MDEPWLRHARSTWAHPIKRDEPPEGRGKTAVNQIETTGLGGHQHPYWNGSDIPWPAAVGEPVPVRDATEPGQVRSPDPGPAPVLVGRSVVPSTNTHSFLKLPNLMPR